MVMLMTSSQSPTHVQQPVVSDEVLGYGSHGMVVYRGPLQGFTIDSDYDISIQLQTRSSEALDAMVKYDAGAHVGEGNFSEGPLVGMGAGILSMDRGRGKQALTSGVMVLADFSLECGT
ncbi:hypothetical protein M0805_000820 [Coniferiporia weirii]|nr:hypothetical protein M0805_000820 [Coniferiporia weirii]